MTTRILIGDVRARLAELPANSVHCCVTSPPYYGLRDYSTGRWEGGDPGCDHGVRRWDGPKQTQGAQSGHAVKADRLDRDRCECGAVRVDLQIGLEPTLAGYIATMVDVFRHVGRVLRDDGTLWLNIGDSYNNRTKVRSSSHQPSLNDYTDREWRDVSAEGGVRMSLATDGLKEKDLMLVPERLALALQDDGWYVRSRIIWAKKACMPESVTDRPTSAHEHIWLLTKQPRYFYDAEAVRETYEIGNGGAQRAALAGTLDYADDDAKHRHVGNGHDGLRRQTYGATGRNQRNVWHLGPEPFPDAHFATFPTEIPRRAILAGTSEHGCCQACGAPWVRQVERTEETVDFRGSRFDKGKTAVNGKGESQPGERYKSVVTGWEPTCRCGAGVVPCTVLDPFAGSGRTGLVADRLGRDSYLIELNPEYAANMERYIRGDAPMFAAVSILPAPV